MTKAVYRLQPYSISLPCLAHPKRSHILPFASQANPIGSHALTLAYSG